MPLRAVAEIAGMGIFDQQVDEGGAADLVRERERRRLVDPHQRGKVAMSQTLDLP
jgi:hypothetical protein